MPGFFMRKTMERVHRNLHGVYFSEAARLGELGMKSHNAEAVFELHRVAWQYAQAVVFRRQSAINVLGVPEGLQLEADYRLELASRCGVTPEEMHAHSIALQRREIELSKQDLRRLRQELDAASDADKLRLAKQYKVMLALVRPGVDSEWDSNREQFLSEYGPT